MSGSICVHPMCHLGSPINMTSALTNFECILREKKSEPFMTRNKICFSLHMPVLGKAFIPMTP